MTETAPADTRLFTDLNGGRIACFRHLGGYGRHAVTASPRGETKLQGRPVWITPLDTLTVMTAQDQTSFLDEVGFPAECEDCRSVSGQVAS